MLYAHATPPRVDRSLDRPGSADRLVYRYQRRRRRRVRRRELVLRIELRPLRVEDLQEVRESRIEPLLRELRRPRARTHRLVQQRESRVRTVVRDERRLRLL